MLKKRGLSCHHESAHLLCLLALFLQTDEWAWDAGFEHYSQYSNSNLIYFYDTLWDLFILLYKLAILSIPCWLRMVKLSILKGISRDICRICYKFVVFESSCFNVKSAIMT